MDWNNWLRVLRWRALEEGDADGSLLSEERRREATARARGGLQAEDVHERKLTGREMGFLAKRADWLEHEMIGWSGPVARVMERLAVAEGRWSWAVVGWLAAVAAGLGLSGLGQEAEFNLLALPLVGILLWNALVMLVAVFWELRPAGAVPKPAVGMTRWLEQRLTPTAPEPVREGETQTGISVEHRFATLARPLALERLRRRLRGWFHIAAALLALGSALGLYARGWSKEYRAVWESTVLSEAQTAKFFRVLFAPASRLLSLPLPLEKVPEMHRTRGRAPASALALPWINLYAATLLLLVTLPRLLLAGLTLARCGMVLRQRLRMLAWRPYLVRTLRAAEGGREKVELLAHGAGSSEAQAEVWLRGVRDQFGSLIETVIHQAPPGEEEEFLANWAPLGPRVVVVFNLATTPEVEVQRRFAEEVRRRLLATFREAEMMVLLDATTIGHRWPAEKTASREGLWTEMLRGVADAVVVATRKGEPVPGSPA